MSTTPEDCLSAYLRAANNRDLPAMTALIDDEAVFLFSNQSVHLGKAAVETAIRRNFDAIKNETYSLANLKWLARSSEVAVCVYDYAWTGEIDGKRATGCGRGTSVLRRSADVWRVVHEHLSRGRLAS